MIRIICGTCGTSQGYKTAANGEFSLPPEEERRLVARGVAEYATRPVMGPASVNAPCEEETGNTSGVAPDADSAGAGGAPDIVDGHFTVKSLTRLTRAGLEQLAGDLGVDISGCRNKAEITELLAAVEVQADEDAEDGGDPPDLLKGAGDIVR